MKSDIPKDIIDEAKRLSIRNGVTMVIYDGDFERRFGDVDVVPGIENSFINQNIPGFILRVKPNLMIEIVSIIDGESKRYFFFYDPKQITDIVLDHSNTEYKRDLKIELINNK